MALLVKGKSLRNSRFNIFAYHAEARLHRDLLAWYEQALKQVAQRYSADQHKACLDILSAPMEIRGYGLVRQQAAEKVKAETIAKLAAL